MSQIQGKWIADSAINVARLATDAVETVKIKDLNVTTGKLAAQAVDEAKLNTSVAGNGITGGGGAKLSVVPDVTGGANLAKVVNVSANGLAIKMDNATIGENGSNQLYIKADSIGPTQIDETATYDFSSGVVSVGTPTASAHATTKAYVDGVAQGLDVKGSARATTVAALPAHTYDNGTSGVGAFMEASANGALPAQDGVTLVVGERLLVRNETAGNAPHNGIYVINTVGDAGTKWKMTRAIDMDGHPQSEFPGSFCFVEEGTTQANNGFVCTSNETVVVGTTDIVFEQFSGAGQIDPGAGLTKSGNTINVGDANKGVQVNADNLEISASEIVGNGLKVGTSTWLLAVEPADFAGTGIEDDGSDNLRLATQGNGIAGGGGSVLSVQSDSTGGANLGKVVNVSSNGVAIRIDNDTIGENGSNQLYIKANSIGAAEIDETDTYNFASGSVSVATQSQGDNSTKAASTAYVDAAVSNADTFAAEEFVLTSTDITNKYVTLSETPSAAAKVCIDIIGGTSQDNGVDFEMSGANVSWNGKTLDGQLAAGDKIRAIYPV